MLTSAWRLTGALLTEIVDAGFSHEQVKTALRTDTRFRAQYLILYDLVNIIVNMNQQRFSVFATTAGTCLHHLFVSQAP